VVAYHPEAPESRETSRNHGGSRPLPGHHNHTEEKDRAVEMTTPRGPVYPMGHSYYAGFANDAQYGTDHTRAKIEQGVSGGFYDPKDKKYHEDLPKATLGQRSAGHSR
jgi:hypothetical protein